MGWEGEEKESIIAFIEFENKLMKSHSIQTIEMETGWDYSRNVETHVLVINKGLYNFPYNTSEELGEAYTSLKEKLESVGVLII